MSFYRDHNGAEVDLVIEQPDSITLVEAKSSATASSSLFADAKRIQRHFGHLSRSCDGAVVYGGDQFQRHAHGRLIPWRMLRAASLPNSDHVISVFAGGRPISGASVLGLFPNKTWKDAITGENGETILDLHSMHLPMTVFVAAEGFAAHVEHDWIPAERALHIELSTLSNGGAMIFPEGTGTLPRLKGRLEPIRDNHDRTYLYASNIAVNEGRQQPVAFVPGEELRLTDADGNDLLARIIDIVGRSSLVEYYLAHNTKWSS